MVDQTELTDNREWLWSYMSGHSCDFLSFILIPFSSPSIKMRRQLINVSFVEVQSCCFQWDWKKYQARRQHHFPCFHSNWLNSFIYLFIYYYIHKPGNRHESLGNAGWRNTAASRRESSRLLPKWSDNSPCLSVLWMFNGKKQESLVNSYGCVLLMLV